VQPIASFAIRQSKFCVSHFVCRFTKLGGDLHMSIETHLKELESKRQVLKNKLEERLTHPSVDDLEISEIKRQKLHLKDEIARLQSDIAAA
jgi:hypothetical protein